MRSPENQLAWEQFVAMYRPVIHRLARQRGLQDADAHDLAQQVLIAIAGSISRWEKSSHNTRFRHWLRRVARNAIVNALSRQPRDRAAGSSSVHELLLQQPAVQGADDLDTRVDLELRRELYLQAAQQVRNDVQQDTWRAFQLTVIDQRSIEAAAAELGKPIGSIYAARSRVMRRLRDAVRDLEEGQP